MLGPAFVNVGQFNQARTARCVFEARGSDEPIGSIFAHTANLDGTAVVRLLTGLYNDMTWSSVVVADVINGQWANVTLDRDYLFFEIDAVHNTGTVDLLLTRIPFDGSAG